MQGWSSRFPWFRLVKYGAGGNPARADIRPGEFDVRTFFLFCTGLGVAMALSARGAAAELKPGDAAPDFSLVGSDGKTYKLSDFKDKQAVVIAWFPKAFTGG